MQKLTRTLQGVIVKKAGEKTFSVEVERKQLHPLYRKVVRTHRKFTVHADNPDIYQVGDLVVIAEVKPISRKKSWKLLSKLDKSEQKG